MNEWDVEDAVNRFTRAAKPNRLALALVLRHLVEWTNANSDGWPYWSKPRAAARAIMAHIESTTSAANREQETTDITDAEMLAAVRPIKSFLSRQKVSAEQRERILRAVT